LICAFCVLIGNEKEHSERMS